MDSRVDQVRRQFGVSVLSDPAIVLDIAGRRLVIGPTFDPPGTHVYLTRLAGSAVEPEALGAVATVLVSHDAVPAVHGPADGKRNASGHINCEVTEFVLPGAALPSGYLSSDNASIGALTAIAAVPDEVGIGERFAVVGHGEWIDPSGL